MAGGWLPCHSAFFNLHLTILIPTRLAGILPPSLPKTAIRGFAIGGGSERN